ncbi:hypothetical protein Cgig2_028301 [Carnegiea gigantea]|uniref:Uncharacterized protein n=1 Tax=Carnegiea gigantea TaxID=171969 RepID=A0A9Q1GVM6_9CARY|nr:hypothetical protein Cgig2_028301 [Carnegiea gigantea]
MEGFNSGINARRHRQDGTEGQGIQYLFIASVFIPSFSYWWNEEWFVTPIKAECSSMNIKMFPGQLGFPFFGEMLTFLWYFKYYAVLMILFILRYARTHHDRVKSLLMNAINHPHALARIAIHVQPAIVTLLNMGRYFASLDFGLQHHSIEQILFAITQGFRAQPSKIPGSAYRYAVKFKKIMRVELEKRKQQNKNVNQAKDLMDELMQMKDGKAKN